MVKSIIVLLLITGCSLSGNIKTGVQESLVPVLTCPAPTEYDRPVLAISTMTDEQRRSPGEVVKHYQATVVQLMGYSTQLELELQKYSEASVIYEELKRKQNVVLPTDEPESP